MFARVTSCSASPTSGRVRFARLAPRDCSFWRHPRYGLHCRAKQPLGITTFEATRNEFAHFIVAGLIRRKKHFREEIERHELGSVPNEFLLHHLRPNFWFSAHLHVKFAAVVRHRTRPPPPPPPLPSSSGQKEDAREPTTQNGEDENEIDLDDLQAQESDQPDASATAHKADDGTPSEPQKRQSVNSVNQSAHATPIGGPGQPIHDVTKFLALDKCDGHRHFLQILDIPCHANNSGNDGVPKESDDNEIDLDELSDDNQNDVNDVVSTETVKNSGVEQMLCYDPEWLVILRKTHQLLSTQVRAPPLPNPQNNLQRFHASADEIAALRWDLARKLGGQLSLPIPDNFVATAPVYVVGPPHVCPCIVWIGHRCLLIVLVVSLTSQQLS